MPALSVWAVRAALAWLFVGALVGALILMRAPLGMPAWGAWIPAHAEMMLVGWMMQLAFGVAHWILPRTSPSSPIRSVGEGAGEGGKRGNPTAVALVIVALNTGVLLVIAGATVAGRICEAAAAIGFAVQGVPRIRAGGWGATGKEGDLVRLKKKVEVAG